MIFIYVGMRLYQYSEDNFDCLKEVFAKKWKGVKHVDLTSLSIFQKTVTFDQNMTFFTYFIAFYLSTFLLAYTFWMEKYKINKSVSLKTVEL